MPTFFLKAALKAETELKPASKPMVEMLRCWLAGSSSIFWDSSTR